MEDTKIYIGLLQMKITVYGINNIQSLQKKIVLNLKTSREIIQNKTREKKTEKLEYELVMENTHIYN